MKSVKLSFQLDEDVDLAIIIKMIMSSEDSKGMLWLFNLIVGYLLENYTEGKTIRMSMDALEKVQGESLLKFQGDTKELILEHHNDDNKIKKLH